MNIALIFQHKLLLGLQRYLLGAPVPVAASPLRVRSAALPATHAPRMASLRDSGATASRPVAGKTMPLRVLRVVESGQPRSSTGRLVISGRMADVCAELDRLVEREAALH
ncbi:MAG: hypothetical protein HXX19_15190 [Rhodoferax sp.]|nr:hypothetical protein [Rhodoferax sp.]